MAKLTDIRALEASADVERYSYRTPMKFGGRVVTDVVVFNVQLTVETRGGARAVGRGSMPLGQVWAWPTCDAPGESAVAAMEALGREAADEVVRAGQWGHPLELAHGLDAELDRLAAAVMVRAGLAGSMPRLAQLVAASPIDAALHDAYGKAHGASAYNLLGANFANADLAEYLTPEFAGEYLDRYTLRAPKSRMPLYHLVGALDPLTDADIRQRVNDGLPETLPEWIAADGLTHLKIKLNGDDLAWDVERVASVERVAATAQADRNCGAWQYSLDFNEKCANVEYVLDFLARLRERSPAAFDRVQYIEQPTHRDLDSHRDQQMHAAAEIKPVVIDESLVDLASFELAREMGYSGVALKACKGHSGALVMGAAAQKLGMFLCVQDLTCPGASFLHSASLAARIPTVAAIEGNSRQYCPAGNRAWAERFPGMFQVRGGEIETGALAGFGLGF